MTLPGVGTILTTLKSIAHVAKEAGKIDLVSQVLDLQQQLLELFSQLGEQRTRIDELEGENRQLSQRIQELENLGDLRKELELRKNLLYRRQGENESGPYCAACFEVRAKLIPLSQLGPAFRASGTHRCPNCKGLY